MRATTLDANRVRHELQEMFDDAQKDMWAWKRAQQRARDNREHDTAKYSFYQAGGRRKAIRAVYAKIFGELPLSMNERDEEEAPPKILQKIAEPAHGG